LLGFPSVRSYNRFVDVKLQTFSKHRYNIHIQLASPQFIGPPIQLDDRLGQLAEDGVLDSPTAAVMGNIPRKVSGLCLDLDDLPLPVHCIISVSLYCAG
jgi:hypothetical protein